jgi:spermidine synthase
MGFRLAAYVAFVLSGAAGLMYEALWARYLGLLVGHSAYAQIIVLAIFLGGMGAGALLTGARSSRLADPLKWYVRAEIAIGILGVLFDPLFRGLMGWTFDALLPSVASGSMAIAATWTVAALSILPQSILLGTTFPLMTAGLLRRTSSGTGRTISILYAANSGGAAVGVLVAGFVLLPALGLPGTVLAAAVLSLIAGGIAFAIVARHVPTTAFAPASIAGASGTVGPMLLAVVGGTAVASFIYEVGWIRMLSLLLSSATHSFELMLSAFILGLALGAWWVRRGADGWRDPLRALGIIQVAMGVAAIATLPLYVHAFHWMVTLMTAFGRTGSGYTGFSLGRYAISLAIMLPATFCAGTTLPLITRILVTRGGGEAAIGRVYGVNTLGSIAGVVLAGLVLLPLSGLKTMLVVGAAVDIALGLWVLAVAGTTTRRRLALAAAAFGAVVVVVALASPGFDRGLLASGVFRTGSLLFADSTESLYYEDGRTATVSAFHTSSLPGIIIATNGKPDASLPDSWLQPCAAESAPMPMNNDAATQTLAPLITLAHKPRARNAAIVGFGSGMSSDLVLAAAPGLDSLVTIEIEPAMVRGARVFFPANRRAYEDPRSTIALEDARAYFARTGKRFDYIFSEPSNPWVAGVSGLFTTEFYQLARRHLADDGVFGQWLHLYELNDVLVYSVLAAIHENFGSYAIYQTDAADILIVASPAPALAPPEWAAVFDTPGLRQDLCHVVPITGAMLDAARLADRAAFAPLLDAGGGANSDFYPVLDLGAERARYLGRRAPGLIELATARFDYVAALHGSRFPLGGDTLAPAPRVARMTAQALAASVRTAGAPTSSTDATARAVARYLVARWNATIATARTPADWPAWLEDFTVVERLVHGAARGVADTTFYAAVHRFLERADPPQVVRNVVRFREGLAGWDFIMARDAGAALVPTAVGKTLIAPRELMEGMVTAELLTGNPRAADSLLQVMAPRFQMEPGDLGMLLLGAHIRAARERGPRRVTPSTQPTRRP